MHYRLDLEKNREPADSFETTATTISIKRPKGNRFLKIQEEKEGEGIRKSLNRKLDDVLAEYPVAYNN